MIDDYANASRSTFRLESPALEAERYDGDVDVRKDVGIQCCGGLGRESGDGGSLNPA